MISEIKIATFFVLSLLLALSPGPDNIYTITLTFREGKKAGFLFLTGLILGCLTHTAILSFGINFMKIEFDLFTNMLRYLGFFYLIFLAIRVYYSKNTLDFDKGKIDLRVKKNIIKGFLMNILNPKVFIFFAIFFPNFFFSNNISHQIQIITLGVIFVFNTLIVFSFFILISDVIFRKFHTIKGFQLIIKYINIFVLLSIAVLILLG